MKIHFIGIGGIGVSALAQHYLANGWQVSGSDLVYSEIIRQLADKGVKIRIGKHKAENLPKEAVLVVYSPAVQKNNPELKEAIGQKIKCQSYPEALGELTRKYFTIAVSGTHGKSTTTAMIGLLLVKAGLDPTIIVGTKVKEFRDSNYREGKSKFLVIEADEHFASFLNYWPKIIVLTTVEKDHLDYYKNLKNILKAFGEYIRHLPEDGFLIINKDDKNISKIIKKYRGRTRAYSTRAYSLKNGEGGDVLFFKKNLKVPGEHNIYNALAALTLARILKIPDKISFNALSKYRGSWRRFEEKETIIKNFKLKIINDYAHHPTEIRATISGAREKFPKHKIWAVFQPHQFQRTYYLFGDFVKAFDEADQIVLCDIYDVAGREEKKISKKVSSKKLTQEIEKRRKKVYPVKSARSGAKQFNGVYYIPDFKKIPQFLKKRIKKNDVILIMGAGDIYKIISDF